MTYDQWRTDSGYKEPVEECDCCGRHRPPLNQVWFCGLQTFACDECCGNEQDGDDYADRAEWKARP